MDSTKRRFRSAAEWLRSLVCVGALLWGGGGLQGGWAQAVPSDTQRLRPDRIEQIRRRIEAIRRTPAQWRDRMARSVSGRVAAPSGTRARSGPPRRSQIDRDRLGRRIEAIVQRVLAEELGARRRRRPGAALVPRPVPPETVRVAPPVPDTVAVGLDRDSVRVVRDTLREIRVEQVKRRLLDTGVFRAFEVNFAFGASALQPRATRTLDAVGAVLERYPTLRVEIAGHTDAVGPDAFNQRLSEARARAVRTYLIDRFDVAPGRLEAQGYGERQPVASNEDRSGRALNRRVEFRVLNPKALP